MNQDVLRLIDKLPSNIKEALSPGMDNSRQELAEFNVLPTRDSREFKVLSEAKSLIVNEINVENVLNMYRVRGLMLDSYVNEDRMFEFHKIFSNGLNELKEAMARLCEATSENDNNPRESRMSFISEFNKRIANLPKGLTTVDLKTYANNFVDAVRSFYNHDTLKGIGIIEENYYDLYKKGSTSYKLIRGQLKDGGSFLKLANQYLIEEIREMNNRSKK